MTTVGSKVFIDEAEELVSAIRGGVLVHVQDGLHPRHLRSPLDSARSLNSLTSSLDDRALADAADALEAWLMLLSNEDQPISHTRTRSLLDQISELEVALVAYKSTHAAPLDIGDFVDESFRNLSSPPIENDHVEEAPVQETLPKEDSFEMDAEMLEVFREESQSLLQNIQANLSILASRPEDRDAMWEIKKSAHTFKGAAGIVGHREASALAHRLEDLLGRVSESQSESNAQLLDLLRDAADCLRHLTDDEHSEDLDARIEKLEREFDEALLAITRTVPDPDSPGRHQPPPPVPLSEHSEAIPKRVRNSSIVRVSLERLDEVVRNVRDLILSRASFEQRIGELQQQVDESTNNALRLQAASGKIKTFESLATDLKAGEKPSPDIDIKFHQSAYELAETARDATVINASLGAVKTDIEDIYDNQRSLIAQIEERLLRLRNVEFGTVATRLQRTVRVTCDEEGKSADVVIENGNLEIDTQIIDCLIEPLMHLLKNAVVHGIEEPETRRLLGKPEAGKITIRVGNDGSYVSLSISDDGRGIAFQPLLEKAIAAGVVSRSNAERMTAAQIRELIFHPGLTTADKLSLNAGRGVGMSIVRESILASNGTIAIETWPQKGTTFRIRVPLPFADLGRYIEPTGELTIAPHTAARTLKVLIVDDSPSVRLVTSRKMQGAGWMAHTAKNGIDALEKLVEMSKLPDVILSDIEMPVMGGYEFLAALRDDESLKAIPVVFVSSRIGVDDREQALNAGAAEYVTKPYDERKLVELVDRLAHNHDQDS